MATLDADLRRYIKRVANLPPVSVRSVHVPDSSTLLFDIEYLPLNMVQVTDRNIVHVAKAHPFRGRFIHRHKGRSPKRGNPWSRT